MLKYVLSEETEKDIEEIFDFGEYKFGNAQAISYRHHRYTWHQCHAGHGPYREIATSWIRLTGYLPYKDFLPVNNGTKNSNILYLFRRNFQQILR